MLKTADVCWRLLTCGSDSREGGESLLHSDVMMEMLQHDPDGSQGVVGEVVMTYAQACLLPPPPHHAAIDFDETHALDFLEVDVC